VDGCEVITPEQVMVCDRGLRSIIDGVRWGKPLQEDDIEWASQVQARESMLKAAMARLIQFALRPAKPPLEDASKPLRRAKAYEPS